ncbi:MAG: Ig-like domain-containing protein [Clostridia bacterium]|nr:Ig-like domain-containing protein [Clostridia bacterium]
MSFKQMKQKIMSLTAVLFVAVAVTATGGFLSVNDVYAADVSSSADIPSEYMNYTLGKGESCKLTNEYFHGIIRCISNDESVAGVSDKGIIYAKNIGQTTVSVYTDDGIFDVSVNVKKAPDSITLDKHSVILTLKQKTTVKMNLSDGSAARIKGFSSSNNSIATVNSDGVITPKKEGITEIKAYTFNGKTDTCIVEIKPYNFDYDFNNMTVKQGTVLKMPDCLNKKLINAVSTDTNVAVVDENGNITAKNTGITTIKYMKKNRWLYYSYQLKVVKASQVFNKNTYTLGKGETCNVTLQSGAKYLYSDNDLISFKNNKLTGKNKGTSVIYAADKNGTIIPAKVVIKDAPTKINLSRNSISIKMFNTTKLYASLPKDCYANSIQYSSSNNKVVTVNSKGYITAVGSGSAVITAKTYNGVYAKCSVKSQWVNKNTKVSFNETAPVIHSKNSVTMSVKLSDKNSNNDISFRSSDPNVAKISWQGSKCTIQGVSTGKATITAILTNGKTTSCVIRVIGNLDDSRTMKPVEKGIDISVFNDENLDFNVLKKMGYSFVIIRDGYGKEISQKDKNFDRYIQGAKKAGLGIGVYHFSYATNEKNALEEAKVCMQIISKYKNDINYGVYYDFEDDTVRYANSLGVKMTSSKATNIVSTFCDTLEKNGYVAGTYTFYDFKKRYFDNSTINKYPFWYAAPDAKTYLYNFDIVQYSWNLSIRGCSGKYDGNYIYTNLFSQIN